MELCGMMRARGDRAGARLALTDAVGSLDGDALETMFLDRDLAVPEGLSQEQAWALRDAGWRGNLGGLADWASLHPEAADAVMLWSRGRDAELYRWMLGICQRNGSAAGMYAEACDILEPGYRGERVDHYRAVELLEESSESFHPARMALAAILLIGRYAGRDRRGALDLAIRAHRETGLAVPLAWVQHLTGRVPDVPAETDGLGTWSPSESGFSPGQVVLADVTGTYDLGTPYAEFRTDCGGFEDRRFMMCPEFRDDGAGRYFLHKPTGFVVRRMYRGRGGYVYRMSEPLSSRELDTLLAHCVESACDSIRGLGA